MSKQSSSPSKTTRPKRKSVARGPGGKAFVMASFNNTIVSITDLLGRVISWSSAGQVGFKGARKSSAYAGQITAGDAAKKAIDQGLKEVQVIIKGPGAGRESAVRALQSAGLTINEIVDKTPIAHNGCRPKKRRRV